MAGSSWIGMDTAIARITATATKADAAARTAVTRGAAAIESSVKRQFEGSHAKGQAHVGGDRPNVVTGTLRRSITHERVGKFGLGEYGTTIGPTAVYARAVELGNPPARAYPYFTPGIEAAHGRLESIGIDAWLAVRR